MIGAVTTGQTTDAFAPTVAPQGATLVDEARSMDSRAATTTRTETCLPRIEAHGEDVRVVHEGKARYEVQKLLGEGGMGTVNLAQDHDIDRRVALKQIRREVGPRGLARFVEEVRTIGRLEHPNIIPIHDVGVDEQGNYFS